MEILILLRKQDRVDHFETPRRGAQKQKHLRKVALLAIQGLRKALVAHIIQNGNLIPETILRKDTLVGRILTKELQNGTSHFKKELESNPITTKVGAPRLSQINVLHRRPIKTDLTINADVSDALQRKFQAGQLQLFYHHWKQLGAPLHILKIIQGYRIPFIQKPPLIMPLENGRFYHTPDSIKMTNAIEELLRDGVLENAAMSPSFLSTMFLVPKSDGSLRPIFNLKRLNVYVHTGNFHLLNMYQVSNFLQPNDWLAKIDLSQAYFHLPIALSHRPFLRLFYKSKMFQMTCLPFGLSSAPQAFASVTNWVAQILRNQGIRILVYLDDFLIAHQNSDVLRSQVSTVLNTLIYLGWKINITKSILQPQKKIEYLGILWDPCQNLKFLPEKKCQGLSAQLHLLLECKGACLKELQSLVGTLNFASFAISRGRLNYRSIQAHCNSLLEAKALKVFPLPQHVLQEMIWWVVHLREPSVIHVPHPTYFLTTDASSVGWGARLNNHYLSGLWSDAEKSLNSNLKEMLAILKALELHALLLRNQSVLIQSDNRTVVSYIRNEGGTRSKALTDLCRSVFLLLDQYKIHFSIHYIPGKFNSEADKLSRRLALPEWHLLPSATKKVFAHFGKPTIDLFASVRAHVVPAYCSLDQKDHKAVFHDAFSIAWNYQLAWIFPPPHLIPRVLSHMNQSQGYYLIVIPLWERVFWRADLISRTLAPPLIVEDLQQVLVDVTTGLCPPNVSQMTIEVWKCGAGPRI
ncbi:hypothetical protein O3G_MSEX009410 [Manduca sexta]|uniref:Reverse transcriptase domain-containing protein n=1 Tax=Manduca sexta TaxID=7130 RepID=A0A922CRI5_MANSE|nr:hypothetical protein O3G_MSEX009410 [Manduca sexta]